MTMLKKLLSRKDGATSIEYAIIASMIGLAVITAAANVGTEVGTIFTEVQTGLGKRSG